MFGALVFIDRKIIFWLTAFRKSERNQMQIFSFSLLWLKTAFAQFGVCAQCNNTFDDVLVHVHSLTGRNNLICYSIPIFDVEFFGISNAEFDFVRNFDVDFNLNWIDWARWMEYWFQIKRNIDSNFVPYFANPFFLKHFTVKDFHSRQYSIHSNWSKWN